ncbi:hypothetical protein VQL36_15920 [Chengkuizengella sp. SCS-71B]|uniref:XkdQ/YqbQ family protein n=1 Tax=Chengkuizengella sp. SCS-71B TaxID=3115290 RepID=UPI0032C23A3E
MKIEVQYDNQTVLNPIVSSVVWSGDSKQAFRKLEVMLINTSNRKEKIMEIEEGKELRFLKEDKELFRGVVFSTSIDLNARMKVVAYDENVYLTKNIETKKFVGKTASDILKELCSDFGIPTGTITNTGYTIPKLILRHKTLWEMIQIALTETTQHTGKKYMVSSKEGKVHLIDWKEEVADWSLEEGINILGVNHATSIKEMKNKVKVISGDEQKAALEVIEEDNSLSSKYGTMQYLQQVGMDQSQSAVKQLAKKLLNQLGKVSQQTSMEALGHEVVVAGTKIKVTASIPNVKGTYQVLSDRHTFQNNMHTMSITLTNETE